MRKFMVVWALVVAFLVFGLTPALAGGRAVALTDGELDQVYAASSGDDETANTLEVGVYMPMISISGSALGNANALQIVNAVDSSVTIQTNIAVGGLATQSNIVVNR